MLEVHAGESFKNKCMERAFNVKPILNHITKKLVRSTSREKAKKFLIKGLNFVYEGNYKAAVREFTRATVVDPKYPQSFFYRGLTHVMTENYNKAVEDFTQVLALDMKNSYQIYFLRGIYHERLGKLDEAIGDFILSAKIEPGHTSSPRQRLELAPKDIDSIDPINLLAFYYQGIGNIVAKNYNKAVKNFTRILALDKSNYQAYFLRGISYERLGNLKEALEDFNMALKTKSKDLSYYYYRINIDRRMNKMRLAQKEIDTIFSQKNIDQEWYL